MSGFLPKHEHLAAERSARAELVRMGFRVQRSPDGGVRVVGPGFELRARAARDLLADLLDGPRGRG